MPELPDIAAYISALEQRILGQSIQGVRIASPFVLRTADPPINAVDGRAVRALRRVGKRIAIGFEDDLWFVIHLMISGRLHWRAPPVKLTGRQNLAALDFASGTLTMTEASKRHRASIHILSGPGVLESIDPGGIEVLDAHAASFRDALCAQNHTLKRALTDPRLISGVGNAYSDEILHAARLSPLAQTGKLTPEEWDRLFTATRHTLEMWVERLVNEARDGFPENVTAFRDGMAVHGRYGEPCPTCGTKILRIRYADNETNYCAKCQTGGRVLADRSLSRLLGSDWPRTLDELESLHKK
jgi:formamidopyrimidine-DNA glycosylase